MTITAEESILINAPADRVWEVAANEFDKIDAWASAVSSSTVLDNGPRTSGAPIAGRVCETKQGESIETFTHFDAERTTFTYEGGGDTKPVFIAEARNTWTVQPAAEGAATLTMRLEMETKGPVGKLMSIPLPRILSKALTRNLEEFRHYVEHGTPHPNNSAN